MIEEKKKKKRSVNANDGYDDYDRDDDERPGIFISDHIANPLLFLLFLNPVTARARQAHH